MNNVYFQCIHRNKPWLLSPDWQWLHRFRTSCPEIKDCSAWNICFFVLIKPGIYSNGCWYQDLFSICRIILSLAMFYLILWNGFNVYSMYIYTCIYIYIYIIWAKDSFFMFSEQHIIIHFSKIQIFTNCVFLKQYLSFAFRLHQQIG